MQEMSQCGCDDIQIESDIIINIVFTLHDYMLLIKHLYEVLEETIHSNLTTGIIPIEEKKNSY